MRAVCYILKHFPKYYVINRASPIKILSEELKLAAAGTKLLFTLYLYI